MGIERFWAEWLHLRPHYLDSTAHEVQYPIFGRGVGRASRLPFPAMQDRGRISPKAASFSC